MSAIGKKRTSNELTPFYVTGSSGITSEHDLDNYGRLRLQLRTLQFNAELSKMNLADDIRELIHYLLWCRRQSFEFKYEMVFIMSKLGQKGSFWLDFGFNSLDDLFIHLDLPNGTTLGMWEVLVRLFDKETFLLVGDEVLGYMTRVISLHQSDSNIRKSDYQAIFDAYCTSYPTFDKKSFIGTVDRYATKKYLLEAQYGEEVKPSRAGLKKGQVAIRVLEPISQGRQEGPQLIHDFSIQVTQCSGCQSRDKALLSYNAHLAKLERIISQQGGDVPNRPLILEKVV